MKAIFAAVCIGSVLLAASAGAQRGPGPGAGPPLPPPPVTADMADAALARDLDAWMADLVAKDRFSGVVLVARDGKAIWSEAYGLADRNAKTAAKVDTTFNYGSIGKALTHTAIVQLIEAGKVSADDTVGKWLPDYPQAQTRAATITQLITHRGGVADFFGPAFRDAPKASFTSNAAYYSFVSKQPPLFAPGEREEYCNGCYAVLGEIIAKASGVSYERYMQDNILARAGMSHTSFTRPVGAAIPYGRPRPDIPLEDVSDFHGVAASAAGGGYTTVGDLLAFDAALRSNKLTSAAGTATILRASSPETGRSTARIGFAGGAPGINALLTGNGAWTVIVLANLDPPAGEAPGAAIMRALAGAPPPRP